jgi:hypothetical protein
MESATYIASAASQSVRQHKHKQPQSTNKQEAERAKCVYTSKYFNKHHCLLLCQLIQVFAESKKFFFIE